MTVEDRRVFIPDATRVNQDSPSIIRFGSEDEREWFITDLLYPCGVKDDRIERLEHDGLSSLTVAKLNEEEYYKIMKKFWEISQQVKEDDQAEGMDDYYKRWFYGTGVNVLQMGSSSFRCGGNPNYTRSPKAMTILFQTQCGPPSGTK